MNRMIDVTTTDPITLEVVRNKVDGIANEMQSTLLRSSFSTVVKEGLDASAVYLRRMAKRLPKPLRFRSIWRL
ncbi:MAG: hypothetical protein CM1200mP41_22950 [Gammaproteobacteria bacterium]|nr:MAG: hypothetical protein CM1200mP41_22950 [Gammaproteobacteria bacterium]